MLGATLQVTCARVCDNLRDAVGADGCSALLDRAMARTESQHPAVRQLRGQGGDSACLDGVAACVDVHGAAAVAAAVDALLAALLDVLAHLIGEDMAIRLMGLDDSNTDTGDGNPTP